MSLLGNIVWLIFGGFLAFLGYMIGGILLCISIVGIPFGLASFKMGVAVLTPFGKELRQVQRGAGSGCLALAINIIWLILVGWELALVHVVSGVVLCVTIVGIPFGMQHFKLIPVALMPFSYSLK